MSVMVRTPVRLSESAGPRVLTPRARTRAPHPDAPNPPTTFTPPHARAAPAG